MAYEPLHHKYRPQTFKDLVGQETIALTLSNALKQARIAPAYLFTGPRGTGKTSSARILAKSLNCLASDRPTPSPCGKCEACVAIAKGSALDVMEIDAASNTGVDNIREIIERSRFAPVQCRYKIYAIDECHMLSTAAFNALLKTLEEPPPQVVFILATTDPQRVLSTIISRCQRFDYRRIPLIEMTNHLRYIAAQEKIAIADDALTLVAQISNGGLRDAESLLDQLSLLPETITVEKVWDLVGAVPEQDLLKLLQAINRNDSLAVLQQCRSLLDRGREPLVVLQNLATFYLNLLIAKTAPQHAELTAVTETCWQELCAEGENWQTALILRGQQHLKESETQLKRTTQPRLWLEVTLLGLLPEAHSIVPTSVDTVVPRSTKPVVTPLPTVAIESPAPAPDLPPQNIAATPTTPVENQVTPANLKPQTASAPQAEQTSVVQPNSESQPVSVPQASPAARSEPVASNSHQDPAKNQQIWSQVVSCLHPPTTQALLKQQCHLVSFDGMSAIVGVSSANLEKMTQKKIPNIEAAFAQVCQRKVKVQIEVTSSIKNTTSNSSNTTTASINQKSAETHSAPIPQPPNPPPPSVSPPAPTVELVPKATIPTQNRSTEVKTTARSTANSASAESLNHSSQHHTAETVYKPEVAASLPAPPGFTPAVISPVTPIKNHVVPINAALNPGELASEPDYAASDLQQAINNLTQSFEGEVVQFDNDLDVSWEDTDNLSKTEETRLEETTLLDRPDITEYDDDW